MTILIFSPVHFFFVHPLINNFWSKFIVDLDKQFKKKYAIDQIFGGPENISSISFDLRIKFFWKRKFSCKEENSISNWN